MLRCDNIKCKDNICGYCGINDSNCLYANENDGIESIVTHICPNCFSIQEIKIMENHPRISHRCTNCKIVSGLWD
jgi:hypothetical protein